MNSMFDFYSPRQLIFGWGRRVELTKLTTSYGKQAWIVCGSKTLIANGAIRQIQDLLLQGGCKSEILCTLSNEPSVEDVDRTTTKLRQAIDSIGSAIGHWVIAIGGGSAIDLAKAVAILITNAQGASVAEFLEGDETNRTLTNPSLPVLAIPTTSGTGSEATKNAVITNTKAVSKKSLRSPMMVPTSVLIDPELSVSAPPNITAWSGLDAITQLIESFVSSRSNSLSRGIVLAGIENTIPALRAAFCDGKDRLGRETMARAAYCSGLALANSGLGMAHGVAAALGSHCSMPHGLACAMMLPTTLRTNYAVCKSDFATLAPIACSCEFENENAAALGLIDAIEELCDQVEIPKSLSSQNVHSDQIPALVKASRGNSMDGNPRKIDDSKLTSILEKLL